MGAALEPIADGVFAWIHDVRDRFTCNVGIVVGDEALTVVDASGVPSSYEPLAAARQRFDRPVARLVLTHAHGDHVAGAAELAPREIVASRASATTLAGAPLVAAFQAELRSIERTIEERNARRFLPFVHFLPSRIPNGITV